MRLTSLFLLATLMPTSAGAASYWTSIGTAVDPILNIVGGIYDYSGVSLEPYANLSSANLTDANLTGAELTNADLTYADLGQKTILINTNLTGAILTGSDFFGSDI